jgi:hypothetical protein
MRFGSCGESPWGCRVGGGVGGRWNDHPLFRCVGLIDGCHPWKCWCLVFNDGFQLGGDLF